LVAAEISGSEPGEEPIDEDDFTQEGI